MKWHALENYVSGAQVYILDKIVRDKISGEHSIQWFIDS